MAAKICDLEAVEGRQAPSRWRPLRGLHHMFVACVGPGRSEVAVAATRVRDQRGRRGTGKNLMLTHVIEGPDLNAIGRACMRSSGPYHVRAPFAHGRCA